jgi:hypothetical protein
LQLQLQLTLAQTRRPSTVLLALLATRQMLLEANLAPELLLLVLQDSRQGQHWRDHLDQAQSGLKRHQSRLQSRNLQESAQRCPTIEPNLLPSLLVYAG